VAAEHRVVSGVAAGVILLVAVLVPILALSWCNRRGWLRVPQVTMLASLLIAAFAYLWWDDAAIRRPITMEELSPSLPGDAATFQTFLRYGKDTPAAAAVKAAPIQQIVAAGTAHIVSNPEKWAQVLREHRAEIEAEWAALAPVRGWWDELAAHPRIGDLTPPTPSPDHRVSTGALLLPVRRGDRELAGARRSWRRSDGHACAALRGGA